MKNNQGIMKSMYDRYIIIGILALGSMSCRIEESELEKRGRIDEEEINTYLNDHNINAERDASGIYYEVLKANQLDKSVAVNDVISIYYDIKTLEGQVVEKTVDSLAPVRFAHNYKSIIPLGVDYAVRLMKKGEKFRFYIPSALGYGGYGIEDYFESYSNLIMEIEVVVIESKSEINQEEVDSIHNYIQHHEMENVEAFSSGLFYQKLVEGEGNHPSEYSTVRLSLERRYLNGEVIDKADEVQIPLNRGYAVKGLEEGLRKMKQGGKAVLILPSKIAFGGSVQVLPLGARERLINDHLLPTKVLPFSPVIYHVELKKIN